MLKETKTHLLTFGIAWIPYLAVTWIYTKLVDGDAKTFWTALGLLVVVRLFFAVIESIAGILIWRIVGKRQTVQRFLDVLRAGAMPMRKSRNENDMLGYISGIDDDSTAPDHVKRLAKEIYFVLVTFENMGILLGARMHAAADAALKIYSPDKGLKAYGEE